VRRAWLAEQARYEAYFNRIAEVVCLPGHHRVALPLIWER
jgi:hypothetical protein